jgi:hypothetical protein
MLSSRLSIPRGSPIWNRLIKSWKRMNKSVEAILPCNQEEVLQVSLWWTTHFLGGHFGYSESRASQLYRRGMCTIEDVGTWIAEHLKRGMLFNTRLVSCLKSEPTILSYNATFQPGGDVCLPRRVNLPLSMTGLVFFWLGTLSYQAWSCVRQRNFFLPSPRLRPAFKSHTNILAFQ